MESAYFKTQKKIGRQFEGLVKDALVKPGVEVIESEPLKYRDKKGWDLQVKVNGEQARIELKLDVMSEATGNVCLEIPAIRQSISPIWLYGLPEQGKINVYSMYLKDLQPFAENYPFKKLVGEFKIPAALVPKEVFISQPFVKKFKELSTLPF